MDVVEIEKLKRPDGSGLWTAYVIAEDDHGVWLYTPQGSTYRGTKDGTTTTCTVGHPTPPGLSVLHLIPPAEWWVANWSVHPARSAVAIDICIPAELKSGRWAYVDLELDLYKSSDGIVGIFDDDEFDDAVRVGLISEIERAECLSTAAQLDERLRRQDPVFDDLSWARLTECDNLELPPLVALP